MSNNEPQPTLFGTDSYTQEDWLLWLKSAPRSLSEMPPEANRLFNEILIDGVRQATNPAYTSPFEVFEQGYVKIKSNFVWPPKKTCPTCGGPLRC